LVFLFSRAAGSAPAENPGIVHPNATGMDRMESCVHAVYGVVKQIFVFFVFKVVVLVLILVFLDHVRLILAGLWCWIYPEYLMCLELRSLGLL
jgi:hypothetical protein